MAFYFNPMIFRGSDINNKFNVFVRRNAALEAVGYTNAINNIDGTTIAQQPNSCRCHGHLAKDKSGHYNILSSNNPRISFRIWKFRCTSCRILLFATETRVGRADNINITWTN